MTIKIAVLYDVTSCSLTETYRSFGGTLYFYHPGEYGVTTQNTNILVVNNVWHL